MQGICKSESAEFFGGLQPLLLNLEVKILVGNTKIIFSCVVKAGFLLNIPLKTDDVLNSRVLEIVSSWFETTADDVVEASCGVPNINSLNKNII